MNIGLLGMQRRKHLFCLMGKEVLLMMMTFVKYFFTPLCCALTSLKKWLPTGALPEQIETSLDDGLARCASFNKRGNLLAAGCNDGRVVVWDFETKGIVKMLIGHVHPVTSVRCVHTLLSPVCTVHSFANYYMVTVGQEIVSFF